MHLGGVTASPAGEWTVQQARNLARSLGGRFGDIKFLIRDRRPDFTRSFDAVLQAAGASILRSAVRAPRMNATCERLAGTLRRELLDRMLILGERHLHAVLAEYQVYYNTARPHQGIAQRVPDDECDVPRATVTDVDTQQIRRKPPQRPDQRVHAGRLRDGRPAGHQPDPILSGTATTRLGPGSSHSRPLSLFNTHDGHAHPACHPESVHGTERQLATSAATVK